MPHRRLLLHWEEARALHGDTVALRAACASTGSTFGVLEYLVRTSTTPLDAVQSVAKYSQLLHDGLRLALDASAEPMILTCEPASGMESVPELAEFAFAILTLCFRHSGSVPWQIGKAHFRADPPHNRAIRERLFGCQVEYRSAIDALALPGAQMRHEMPHADRTLNEILHEHAADLMHKMKSGRSVSDRVRDLLVDRLPAGLASADDIATALGSSTRTLHRRLDEENASFRAILDAVRSELAFRYLAEPTLTLADVAARLGFSHVNGFRRALRRWTSQRPTELRRKLGRATERDT